MAPCCEKRFPNVLLKPSLPDGPILIAVSGGSDSVALLHRLARSHAHNRLHVATVDHGLRAESAMEAQTVKSMADALQLPHQTLVWGPPAKPSSAESRQARYELLLQHADRLEAKTLALGHTLDDQAETIWMRAQRHKVASDTRGLSGMAEWSSCNQIKLWRPLLADRREELRNELRRSGIHWIDDPTNENTDYERVRIRNHLTSNGAIDAELLARLAGLSMRLRGWINHQVSDALDQFVTRREEDQWHFAPPDDLPRSTLLETLSVLILIVGGLGHRTPTSKFAELADHIHAPARVRKAVGRCLVVAGRGSISVARENRNIPELPDRVKSPQTYDGRYLLQPNATGQAYTAKPYIRSLAMFRAQADDPVHASVARLLNSGAVQHKERF